MGVQGLSLLRLVVDCQDGVVTQVHHTKVGHSCNSHALAITGWQVGWKMLISHSQIQPCPLVDDGVRVGAGGAIEVFIPRP